MEVIVPQPKTLDNGNLDVWPTLGPQICDFLEERFVYGPGPIKGEPYKVRNDIRYMLYRAYEHYPEGYFEDFDGEIVHLSGRRHFSKVVLSLPKGSAKCLAAGTKLRLEGGDDVVVEDLQPGDMVQSFRDGEVVYKRVRAVELQPKTSIYEVVTTSGRRITVSAGHKFLVGTGSWVEVEWLERDFVLTIVDAEGWVGRDRVRYVEHAGYDHTWGVEIEDTHVHVTNDIVTHNTELMALVSCVELHPDAPVRFNGYDPSAPGGLAPGRSVVSPFIPLLAPTKDQLDDLAYGVAKEVMGMIPDQLLFDVNNERIMINGEGESKILPVAASAGRLDGLKPTFQCIDEAHRMFSDRHHQAVQTMENNLKKRYVDDPWQLSTTTAGDPSEPSVAKAQYDYGMKVFHGKVKDPRTFFYHRATSDANAKFETMGQRLRALKEASGEEAAQFRDLFSVAAEWDEDGVDKAYLERVWCNRWVQSSMTAFDRDKFKDLGDKNLIIPRGSAVTLGFDGAVSHDSTAIVMTDVKTGVQNLVGLWERPKNADFDWRVPIGEVHDTMNSLMEEFNVTLFYGDPPYWQEALSVWESKWGRKIIEWPTRNTNNMYYAIRAYQEAIDRGDLGHDANPALVAHVGNAGKNMLNQWDDEKNQKFRLAKISPDRKFDAAMAAILSWQARLDSIKQGIQPEVQQIPRRIR